jgi:hypothetical protein
MKRKRTRATVEKLAAEFEQRMEWLETAWSVTTEYEVDLSSGSVWLKLTMPGNSTAMVIRCDVAGITLPGNDQ